MRQLFPVDRPVGMDTFIEAVRRLLQRMLHPVNCRLDLGFAAVVSPAEKKRDGDHTDANPYTVLDQGGANGSQGIGHLNRTGYHVMQALHPKRYAVASLGTDSG